uniref:Metal-dependent phosphohydrolase, HD subdomain n=1 Tax=Arundo donax TaxID=35708 RepID=A0A0A9FR16_ARUDO
MFMCLIIGSVLRTWHGILAPGPSTNFRQVVDCLLQSRIDLALFIDFSFSRNRPSRPTATWVVEIWLANFTLSYKLKTWLFNFKLCHSTLHEIQPQSPP